MAYGDILISQPNWLADFLAERTARFDTDTERMRLVIELAATQVRHETGGPFAAAVFESATGRLIAAGVNRVIPTHCSLAHAEMVALALAQQRLGTHDLSAVAGGCELASSAEPCAMCLGAIPWSGVQRLVFGALDADVRAIGFDEGHKPEHWANGLNVRGIAVRAGHMRAQAVEVLQFYVKEHQTLY